MARYVTVNVPRSRVTHTVDTKAMRVLCGSRTSSATTAKYEDSPPTCARCLERDPRANSGGPFALSHILQF